MRIFGSLILLSAIAVSACAHDPGAAAPANAPVPAPDLVAPAPPPISVSEVTVENLLRWPLEGPTGVDKVEAGLHQVMQMKPLRGGQFRSTESVRLADGNVVNSAWLRRLVGSVIVNLAQEPCVSPEYAKGMIGAVQSPYVYDMHGVDHGKSYSIKRNTIWLTFMTTPGTYRCVTSIQINPIEKSAP